MSWRPAWPARHRNKKTGISQINTAVGQLDKVTQATAANAEECAAAAEEMNGQALSLKEAVNQLSDLVGASEITAEADPPGQSVPFQNPRPAVKPAAVKKSRPAPELAKS